MKTDTAITTDIVSALVHETNVDTSSLGISIRLGTVFLTGSIASHDERMVCLRVVKAVEGVKRIADHTTIKVSRSAHTGDADIAGIGANAIKWVTTIPEHAVKITVTNGWITLTGRVEDREMKSAAEEAVHNIEGTRGVHNLILVRPDVPEIPVADPALLSISSHE
jgi:osmotically-inducible protein OsmY